MDLVPLKSLLSRRGLQIFLILGPTTLTHPTEKLTLKKGNSGLSVIAHGLEVNHYFEHNMLLIFGFISWPSFSASMLRFFGHQTGEGGK